jgi:hypothetical protein
MYALIFVVQVTMLIRLIANVKHIVQTVDMAILPLEPAWKLVLQITIEILQGTAKIPAAQKELTILLGHVRLNVQLVYGVITVYAYQFARLVATDICQIGIVILTQRLLIPTYLETHKLKPGFLCVL